MFNIGGKGLRLQDSYREGSWTVRPLDLSKKSEFSTITIWICWIECSQFFLFNFQITSFILKHLLLSLIWKWLSSTYEKNKLVPSILQVYLELILRQKPVMEGKEGAHGKIGGKECGTSRQPCAAFLHNPTKLCYFLFPIQNGPRFKQAKNNETKENTHPILTFWIGPFGLYFLFPHLISEHVMLPQKTVSFKFRPIQVYMRVQF